MCVYCILFHYFVAHFKGVKYLILARNPNLADKLGNRALRLMSYTNLILYWGFSVLLGISLLINSHKGYLL